MNRVARTYRIPSETDGAIKRLVISRKAKSESDVIAAGIEALQVQEAVAARREPILKPGHKSL